MIKKITILLLAIYLGFSPIFWAPGISEQVFFSFKAVSLIFLSFLLFLYLSNKVYMSFLYDKYFIIALFSLLLLLISILPHIFLSESNDQHIILLNLFLPILFLFIARLVSIFNIQNDILKYSTLIFVLAVVCWLILIMFIPFERSPLNNKLTLIETGLGGSRTGWSPSIALFLPLILFYFNLSVNYKLFISTLLIMSQIIVGGRGGLIVTLPFIIYFLLSDKNISFRVLKIFLFSIIIIFIIWLNLDWILDSRLVLSLTGDDISTGRIERFWDALAAIKESWLIGYGSESTIKGFNVHNVFIKMWFQYGILSFVILLFIVIYPFILFYYTKQNKALIFILLAGILVGLVEPSIIIGNFTTYSLWWFSYGLIVANAKSQKLLKLNNK